MDGIICKHIEFEMHALLISKFLLELNRITMMVVAGYACGPANRLTAYCSDVLLPATTPTLLQPGGDGRKNALCYQQLSLN